MCSYYIYEELLYGILTPHVEKRLKCIFYTKKLIWNGANVRPLEDRIPNPLILTEKQTWQIVWLRQNPFREKVSLIQCSFPILWKHLSSTEKISALFGKLAKCNPALTHILFDKVIKINLHFNEFNNFWWVDCRYT